jgi:hypothetical protein
LIFVGVVELASEFFLFCKNKDFTASCVSLLAVPAAGEWLRVGRLELSPPPPAPACASCFILTADFLAGTSCLMRLLPPGLL